MKSYQASSPTTVLWDWISVTRKKPERNINTGGLNNTFLNNQQVTEEIKREIKKFLETNDYENTTTHYLCDTEKAVLRGKFIAMQSYLKKQEKHQIDNLTLHAKILEKDEQNPPKLIEGKKNHKDLSRNKIKINETNNSKD